MYSTQQGQPLCGLYYKHIMIENDDSTIINKFEASLTDNVIVITYDRHMFIVKASGLYPEKADQGENDCKCKTPTHCLKVYIIHYTKLECLREEKKYVAFKKLANLARILPRCK